MNRELRQEPSRDGRRRARRRGGRLLAAGLLALVVSLSACSEEGQDRLSEAAENITTAAPADGGEEAPPETAPPETAPPETAPPETAPPETAAPEQPASSEDELSTEDWVLLILLGLAAVAIFVGVTSVASRRSEARAAAKSELRRYLGEVVGQSRWVHDSGSIELLLATDPDQLTRTWNDLRTRIVNLEGQIASRSVGTGDENLDRDITYLSQCLSDLRAACEGYVTTRLRARADQTELTRTAGQAVSDRRALLRAAIEPVSAAMRS